MNSNFLKRETIKHHVIITTGKVHTAECWIWAPGGEHFAFVLLLLSDIQTHLPPH